MSDVPSPASSETLMPFGTALNAVDHAIDRHIANGDFPGAVTLVMRGGKLEQLRASGMQNLANEVPLATNTIFRAYSMTKPITGTAMMILRDEGHWQPDDPVAKHLPEFENIEVYLALDEAGCPKTEPVRRPPTMADLMSHRAGLAYALGFEPLVDADVPYYQDARLIDSTDLRDFVGRITSIPLAHQPGTRWRYSWSMDVQGAIVERLTGTTLPEFMRTRLFEPLGMIDTGFSVPRDKQNRLAQLYMKSGSLPLTPIDNPLQPDPVTDPPFALGGAGLYTTAPDYARYASLLLGRGQLDGKRLVSEAAIAEQMTNLLPAEMLDKRFELGRHKFRPGYGYGYNGVVVADPDAADLPVGQGTYFWDGAAGTWFWVDPVHDLLFVGMIQVINDGAPNYQEEMQRLIGAALMAHRA